MFAFVKLPENIVHLMGLITRNYCANP